MNYDYKCSKCEHVFERTLPMADHHLPEKEPCPECNEAGTVYKYFGSGKGPALIDPVRLGVRKPTSEFKEVLSKIHERMPGSKLNESRFL